MSALGDGLARHQRARTFTASLAAGILCLPAAGAACDHAIRADPHAVTSGPPTRTTMEDVPIVHAALNTHLTQVAARSTLPLDLSTLADNSSKIIDVPARFRYDGQAAGTDALSFELPTGRYIALTHFGGWIYSVTISPQARAGSLGEAVATANMSLAAVRPTRWRRSTQCAEQVQDPADPSLFADAEATTEVVGCFVAGTAELRILIERDAGAPSASRAGGGGGDRFYVSIELTDTSRVELYQRHVMAKRRTVQGSATTPLPLSAFIADTIPPG